MRIITVTENRQLPGNYEISFQDSHSKKSYTSYDNGCAASAARAMRYAMNSSRYQIFASTEVLNCIPQKMRSKTI